MLGISVARAESGRLGKVEFLLQLGKFGLELFCMANAGPPSQNPFVSRNREDAGFEEELWQEGLGAFYREDDETALTLLLEVVESNPKNLRAIFLAMLCAANLSDEETLEELYGVIRRKGSRHPYAVGCEAVRAMFYANYERAEHLFKMALRALPDDIDLNIGLGILYDQNGDGDKSAEVYRRVLELAPDNIRARISLGMSLAISGEYLSALAEYEYAKRLDPSVENPHQHLGRDFYSEGMIAEAVQEFMIAITEEPDEPTAYFFLMDCYKRLGQVDEALDVYELIRERFKDRSEELCGLYQQFQLFQEAKPILEKLVQEHPDDVELLLQLSQVCQETGDLNTAIKVLNRALDSFPDAFLLWSNLARLYYEDRDYQKAVMAARRAIQLNPEDGEIYGLLSDALLFLGKFEEAEASAREMERARDRAWHRYQQRFAGKDETGDSDQ
jgi:pentatricopeptide repeat protein